MDLISGSTLPVSRKRARLSVVQTAGAWMARLPGALICRWFATLLSSFVDVIEPMIASLARRRRLVVVEREDGAFGFHKVSGSRATFIGSATAPDDALREALQVFRAGAVELRLPAEKVVTSTLTIPQAALQYADQVVASRLDRLTPWRPDTILYGFATSPVPSGDGQRDLYFAASSRQIAEHAIDRLGKFGLTPSAMGSTDAPVSQRLTIDLFRGAREGSNRKWRRGIAMLALGGLLLSAIAYLISLFYVLDSDRQISDLDMRLTKARLRLVNATSDSTSRQGEFALIAAKVPARARFMLISRLAAIVPDNTYLDELDIKDDTLRMAGTSTDAFSLIKLIEADPVFSGTKFISPVTRRDDGRDGFDLSASIGTKPEEPSE